MKFSAIARVTALMCLGLGLQTSASAQDAFSASASLNNLRIRLIDLAPNDGVTPSISVNGTSLSLSADQTPWGGNPVSWVWLQDSPAAVTSPTSVSLQDAFSPATPSLAVQGTVAGTSATVGNSWTASSRLSAEVLANSPVQTVQYVTTNPNTPRFDPATGALIWGTETTTREELVRSNTAAVSSQVTYNPETGEEPTFTLSANTLMVLEGTATVSAQIDKGRVDSFMSTLSPDSALKGWAQAQMVMALGTGSYVNPTPGTSLDTTRTWEQHLSAGLAFDPSGAFSQRSGNGSYELFDPSEQTADGIVTASGSRTFALSYANGASADALVYFYMSQSAVVSEELVTAGNVEVTFTPNLPTVPNIPEPGTWAQMGLGLMAMIAAVRHRRGLKGTTRA
jgi:PEP-CTERM motif